MVVWNGCVRIADPVQLLRMELVILSSKASCRCCVSRDICLECGVGFDFDSSPTLCLVV
jgi:hypothetical protein